MAAFPDSLLHHPALWRAESQRRTGGQVVPTGLPALDARLPNGGWPLPGLVELLYAYEGVGELSLFVPALQRLDGTAAWIAPPALPYAPALQAWGLSPSRQLIVNTAGSADTLWAMEQALRSGACNAVLGWADEVKMQWLRRLKLAALESGALGILFRPLRRRVQPSAATVRIALRVERGARGISREIQVLKVQGGRAGVVPWPMP